MINKDYIINGFNEHNVAIKEEVNDWGIDFDNENIWIDFNNSYVATVDLVSGTIHSFEFDAVIFEDNQVVFIKNELNNMKIAYEKFK